MMKYIFCILFGSLLMLGFHYTPDEKVQEAQPNAGVVAMDVQSDTPRFNNEVQNFRTE